MAQTKDKLIEKVTKLSIQTALEYMEKEKKRREKEKHDRRLRNIKLLLRNYRRFVKHCENVKVDMAEIRKKLDNEVDLATDEIELQSILRSKERTLAMVNYINQALKVYKFICQESADPDDLRRYETVYQLYISDEKKTVEEIAAGHFVHKRTVYKDIDKACESLSVLMFGIDGVKLG